MSFQEDLINDLTGFTLGRKYLFRPDDYHKGNATREPADLAWYCRDTLVLMYMTETGRGWEDDATHNVRQAKGWMRAWRTGKKLSGSNDVQTFAVPYQASLATIILSISADPELDQIVEHIEVASQIGVDSCVTVSNSLMKLIADRGAGITDLAAIVSRWGAIKAIQPELTDTQWFSSLRGLSVQEAAKKVGWAVDGVLHPDLELATRYVRGLRAVPAIGKPDDNFDGNALFADFSFTEQFILLFSIGKAAEIVRSGAPYARIPFEIDRCKGIVTVAASSRWFSHLGSLADPDCDFEYLFELELGLTVVSFRDLRSPSRAWKTLRP